MLKYIPKPWTFLHRMKMCNGIVTGDEFEDAIRSLTCAAGIIHAWDDYTSEILLLIAEKMCSNFITNIDTWEDYESLNPEVFKHFTSGAEKLTEEQYNQRN